MLLASIILCGIQFLVFLICIHKTNKQYKNMIIKMNKEVEKTEKLNKNRLYQEQ